MARMEIERVRAASADAAALPNPELTFGGASDFAFQNAGEARWSVGVSQAFPVTSRLRRLGAAAALEVDCAVAEVYEKERLLLAEAERLCDRLESTGQQVALVREQMLLNTEFARLLEAKVKNAEASPLTLAQVKVATAALVQQELRLGQKILSDSRALARLAGRTDPFDLVPRALPDALPVPAESEWENHAALNLQRAFLEMARGQTAVALAQRWADVTVAVAFEEEQESASTNSVERQHFLGLSISLPLPLYNRNAGAIDASRLKERQAERTLEATAFELRFQEKDLRERYTELTVLAARYQADVLRAAQDSQAALEAAFFNGEVGSMEVFRAREELLSLKAALLEMHSERLSLFTEWRCVTARNRFTLDLKESFP